MRRLPRMVADTEVGKSVDILVWRGNKKVRLKAKVEELGETSAEVAAKTPGSRKGSESTIDALGLRLSSITAKLKSKYSLDKDFEGVVVTKVTESGPAAEKGIRPGDVIVEVGLEEVITPDDVLNRVKQAAEAKRKSVLLLLDSSGEQRFVAVELSEG